MTSPLKILFIGDIVGKLGRKGVNEIVPRLKKKHALDWVIANIENLAHGKGITKSTFEAIKNSGIDAFTSGNHIWHFKEGVALLQDENSNILRPANYPDGVPGRGFLVKEIKGKKILLLNLIGRVFMKDNFDDPFRKFDEIMAKNGEVDEVIVDFHAEATSEKKAFAWYVAGRASAVLGTHTHIPTADAQLLGEHQLGYVSDVGMVGAEESILGVEKSSVIEAFLTQLPFKPTMIESGRIVFNSVLMEIESKKAIKIERIDHIMK
jgi:metallophosphoesterase (TIGR00282 family)